MDCPKRCAVDGLPEDSLVEILARVPARSVCRSKCVAKGWRDLIEDPLHGKKIPQTLQGFFSIDEEIYGHGHRGSGAGHIGFTSLRASSAPLGIDGRLSFLTKLPMIGIITFADSCNGLHLFQDGPKSEPSDRFGYIVCNPATKRGLYVPRPPYPRGETSDSYLDRYFDLDPVSSHFHYLVFDPVVSSHFHIVQFWGFEAPVWEEDEEGWQDVTREVRISVHVYSSETRTWSHIQNGWGEELGQSEGWCRPGFIPRRGRGCAVLNGVLHFIISDQEDDHDQIVAVDVQLETQRFIPLPTMAMRKPGYVVQSQGHLHYIGQAFFTPALLSIWVLEDTQKWVLKHSVSFVELFGKRKCSGYNNKYRVVAMHPDGNVVFIVQNQKLISYDMDHKLVNVIATLENNISAKHIIPYVPCFLETPVLSNKH